MTEMYHRLHDSVSAAAVPLTARLVEQQVAHASLFAAQTPPPSVESVRAFADPEVQMSAREQLSTVAKLWRTLGSVVPFPSEPQLHTMSELAEAHPTSRVVPVRFLNRAGRAAIDRMIPDRPQLFPDSIGGHSPLTTRYDPGYVPDTPWRVYGRLLEQPLSAIEEGGTKYSLAYKTPAGQLASRLQYESELMDSGHAIPGWNGSTWSFPMVNIGERRAMPADATVAEMYDATSPWLVPEAEIVLGLLSEMAGRTPDITGGQINLVNEAIFAADETGAAGELVDTASIDWYPHFQHAAAYGARATNNAGNFRIVEAMSSLAA